AFIKLASGALQLDTCRFVIAGAHIQVQAFYKPLLTNAAVFTLQIRADSFDVQRAYKEVPLFAEMASAARYTRGRASLEYELNGKLNSHMYPIMPSLVGKGWVKLEDVQVKGLKLFNAVGKATGKDSLNNPNLKAVVINSQIANNIITLPRTRMRVFGFRPGMEGQIGLNGSLNLQFRLGLPPFGILGIPMSITGTSDKPLVKLRRSRPEDELDTEAEEAEEKE
ncbi:MAG TPA: AsmA-like C-terminal region-containing protein, partial [Phnomibacter sp.]|nr:AsmA-like C-terminal region-containing protein [Phnomibacter sp.]